MTGRLPFWFRQKVPDPRLMQQMECLLRESHLHTICESALCPNAGECFSRGTATFLILGNVCSRRCSFCAVTKGSPLPPDPLEPSRVLDAAVRLGLRYAVITSVTRDDLPDGGAAHFAGVVRKLHSHQSRIAVEVLVPDFRGSRESMTAVIESSPEVINHNVETVPRLYREVRPGADYERSLRLLAQAKQSGGPVITKSGMMVGLGETDEEIVRVMEDLRSVGCDLVTIGQYLQPSARHRPVARFVLPEEFAELEMKARALGFAGVASGPLVRSSFHAAEMYAAAVAEKAHEAPGGI